MYLFYLTTLFNISFFFQIKCLIFNKIIVTLQKIEAISQK